jgi:hypothetical protein
MDQLDFAAFFVELANYRNLPSFSFKAAAILRTA